MSIREMIQIIPAIALCCYLIFIEPYLLCKTLPEVTPDEYLRVILHFVVFHTFAISGLCFLIWPFIMDEDVTHVPLVRPYWEKFSVRNQELHILPYEDNDK